MNEFVKTLTWGLVAGAAIIACIVLGTQIVTTPRLIEVHFDQPLVIKIIRPND